MKTTALFAFFASSSAAVLATAALLGACSDDPVAANDAAAPASDAAADTSTATSDSAAGDSATPGDSAAPTDASDAGVSAAEQRLCDALTSRNQCFDGTGGPQTCDAEDKCFARAMVPAALDSYAACHAFPSCKGQDGCLETAGTAAAGQAASDYTTACMAKVTECGAQFPDDELCSAAAFAYQGVGAAAATCLTKPCADQKACFDAALAPIVACKQL